MNYYFVADEQLTNDTVAMILQVNERAQKVEMILDEMEKERYRVPLLKGSLTKKSQNHTDTLCCTYT